MRPTLQAAAADYRRAGEARWAALTRVNECTRALRKAEARLHRVEALLKERERRLHKSAVAEIGPPREEA